MDDAARGDRLLDVLRGHPRSADHLVHSDPLGGDRVVERAGEAGLHLAEEEMLFGGERAAAAVEDRLDGLQREEALTLKSPNELQALQVLVRVPRHVAAGLLAGRQEPLLNVEVDRLALQPAGFAQVLHLVGKEVDLYLALVRPRDGLVLAEGHGILTWQAPLGRPTQAST